MSHRRAALHAQFCISTLTCQNWNRQLTAYLANPPPSWLRCVSRTRSARVPWRRFLSCEGFGSPCGCLRALCGRLLGCPAVIWTADRVAEWGVMAGGGIIVAQRQRANQYTGKFTFFTLIAVLAAATTGLVESHDPTCQHTGPVKQTLLSKPSRRVMRTPLTRGVPFAASGLRQW